MLNPDAPEFVLSNGQDQIEVIQSANARDEVVTSQRGRYQPVLPRRTGVLLDGQIDRVKVNYLVDTGSEPTVISLDILKKLPNKLRTAFQDSTTKHQVADGSDMIAKGLVLCNVTVGDKTVLDNVFAAPIADTAILGLSMRAAGSRLGAQCRRRIHSYKATKTFVRRIMARHVHRVTVADEVEIPALSEAIIAASVEQGKSSHKTELMVGPRHHPRDSLFIA